VHEAFGFLTMEPNARARAVHEKAMRVILQTSDKIDLWMNAPIGEALALQGPLPQWRSRAVASGTHEGAAAGPIPAPSRSL
jgi:putative SOS response-associated peptidase YedK